MATPPLVDSVSHLRIAAGRLRQTLFPWTEKSRVEQRLQEAADATIQRVRAHREQLAPHTLVVGILLAEHFGDIVACEPLLPYLRRNYPGACILWLTKAAYAGLLRSHPCLDAVIEMESISEATPVIESGVLDVAIDLHLHGKACARYGRTHARAGDHHSIDADNYYRHGTLLEVMAHSAGLEVPETSPRLYLSKHVAPAVDRLDLPKDYLVVHTRSNEDSRNWSPAGWSALTEHAGSRHGLPVVEIGLEPTLPAMGNRVISLCGRLTLLETAEVVRRATCFVGIDSGPAHLANAFERPSVILLGRYRSFERYMPFTGYLRDHAEEMVIQWPEPSAEIPASEVLQRFDRVVMTSSGSRS